MNPNILVAYYTKGGASEKYAETIAETLQSKGLNVKIYNLKKETPDISNFDTIILGTGVRMFMVYRRWKKIIKQKELHNKTLYMFLSSGMAMEEPKKAVEKFLSPLVKKYDLEPKSMVSFPGIFPEKWAENEKQKNSVKPELAKTWAEEISRQVKK